MSGGIRAAGCARWRARAAVVALAVVIAAPLSLAGWRAAGAIELPQVLRDAAKKKAAAKNPQVDPRRALPGRLDRRGEGPLQSRRRTAMQSSQGLLASRAPMRSSPGLRVCLAPMRSNRGLLQGSPGPMRSNQRRPARCARTR